MSDNKKMKIGFFIAALLNHGGGAEKHFIMMGNAMAKKGHEIGIVNLDKSFYKKLSIILSIYYASNLTFIRYRDADVRKMLHNVKWLKVEFKKLRKNLQKFDVIYVKNEILDLGILKLIGFKKLPPVIVGIHTPIFYPITSSFYSRLHNFFYSSCFYRWLIKDCKAIRISNSELQNLVSKRYPFFKGKVFKIFNPIDIRKFKPEKKLKEKNKKFKILFVGRLTEQKGIDMLIETIKDLSKKPIFKNLIFVIAGSGKFGNKISNLQKKFNNLTWLGHVLPHNIVRLYSSSDILIAPSKWEGLSNVILEAQSCGLPAIVSNIAGSRDIIINNSTGFLVNNSAKEFVSKITSFYLLKGKNKKRFISFSVRARENIEKRFSPDKTIAQLEKMFFTSNNIK